MTRGRSRSRVLIVVTRDSDSDSDLCVQDSDSDSTEMTRELGRDQVRDRLFFPTNVKLRSEGCSKKHLC